MLVASRVLTSMMANVRLASGESKLDVKNLSFLAVSPISAISESLKSLIGSLNNRLCVSGDV